MSVFAASRDSPWSHVAWSQALDIDVPLLSDWNGDAVRSLGIAHEYRRLRDVAERSAFLVGADRAIHGAWRYETDELPDFDELVAAARTLGATPSPARP